jgi:hypothetical protein
MESKILYEILKIRDLDCGDEIPDVVVEELGAQEGLEVDLSNKHYT